LKKNESIIKMYIKLYLDKMLEQNSKVTYEQHVKIRYPLCTSTVCTSVGLLLIGDKLTFCDTEFCAWKII
jgi:hypothetical protein